MKLYISIFFAAAVFGLSSCGRSDTPHEQAVSKTEQDSVAVKEDKTANALKFINAYIENVNKMNEAVEMTAWVDSSKLVTENYKTELKHIIDKAYKEDPELGIDGDPILDAQDYPTKGFVLESFDERTNYLIVRGIDWPDFKLAIKVMKDHGSWLVDGSGIVNIPADKQAKR